MRARYTYEYDTVQRETKKNEVSFLFLGEKLPALRFLEEIGFRVIFLSSSSSQRLVIILGLVTRSFHLLFFFRPDRVSGILRLLRLPSDGAIAISTLPQEVRCRLR